MEPKANKHVELGGALLSGARRPSPALTISVAMCTYNGGRYVSEQLESMRDQSRTPDEIIICDDRSSDTTVQLAEAFAASAPFAVRIVVNDARLGSTKNFEHAIDLCSGDIIVLSDQDDVWNPDKLARLEAAFARSPATTGMVFSDAELVDSDGVPLGSRLWQYFAFTPKSQRRMVDGHAFDVLLRKHVVVGATMAFKSEFKKLILPFPGVGVHDRWIAILIAAVAGVALVPEPLIRYRKHAGQQAGAALASVAVAVAKSRVWEQLALARRPAGNVYADQAVLYAEVKARLRDADGFQCDVALLRGLDDKIEHLNTRASLPPSLASRLPIVIPELFRLRYHHYSNGIYSFAKDLAAGRDPR